MKQCSRCKETLPLKSFHKSRTGQQGVAGYCKKCASLYYKSRYVAKNEKMFKSSRKRQCKGCREIKSISDFSKKVAYCKPCVSERGYIKNVEKYGITHDQYKEMLALQNNVCKLCYKPDNRRLAIDHDHSCCPGYGSCGKCIRGLLCRRCNQALGLASDDPALLERMADYLR